MVYIRTKKINGNNYAYLVESIQTPKGSRQKVRDYLGRIYSFTSEPPQTISTFAKTKNDFINNMALPILKSIGFIPNKDLYTFKKFIYCPLKLSLTRTTSGNSKESVISVNDGHLCSFTLNRLIKFKPTKDITKDAQILAKYFLEAGLLISQEEFVKFYQL